MTIKVFSPKSKTLVFTDNIRHFVLIKLTGMNVDECDCKIEDIIRFNNYFLKPRLDELLKKDYFRFFKVSTYVWSCHDQAYSQFDNELFDF